MHVASHTKRAWDCCMSQDKKRKTSKITFDWLKIVEMLAAAFYRLHLTIKVGQCE